MTTERPPWFKCYPTSLLGACVVMPADAQLLYYTILMRIYEVGGPIPDTTEMLSRRTGMRIKRVDMALAYLEGERKVSYTQDSKIDSRTTHEFLSSRESKIHGAKMSANIRWSKTERKQQSDDANAMRRQCYIDLDKEKKKITKKKFDPYEVLMVGGGLSEQTAKDVVEYRKARKAVVTPRAIQMLAKEFFDCGDPELAAATMIRRNWQGFDKSWDWRPKNGGQHPAAAASGIWISQEDPRWGEFVARYREAHSGRQPPVDKNGGWHFSQEL